MKKDTKKLSLEKKQNNESEETFGILIEYLIKSIPYLVTAFVLFYIMVTYAELYHNSKNELIANAAINTPDNAAITEKQNDDDDFELFNALGWYYYLLLAGDDD